MTALLPLGPRRYAGATARIAVPTALPLAMRQFVREVVGIASANPGKGEADELLANICRDADLTQTALFLHVKPEGDTDLLRLVTWYHAHGFVTIQAEPVLMTRMPLGGMAQTRTYRREGVAA